MFRFNRTTAKFLAVIGLLAVASPVWQNWRDVPRDSFPLSYYPMFSQDRGQTVDVIHIVGFDSERTRHVIPITFAGDGGFNQVRKQINRTYAQGRLQSMCEQVGRRLTASEADPYADIVEVLIVRGTFKISDYFAGKKHAVREEVLARVSTTP
jgi:hypothetical protein